MAGMVILTFVLFFLAENGRINSFATYFVAIFLLMLVVLDLRRIKTLDWRWMILPVCLLGYLAASSLWSDPTAPVLKYLGYAALLICFLVAFQACDKQYRLFLPTITNMIIAAAFASACWSIYLHVSLPEYQPLPEPRLYGLGRLNNPVISATAYGFAAILAIHSILFDQDLTRRGLFAVSLVVFLAAIVLSGTRSIWLGLLISTALGLRFLFHGNLRLQFLSVVVLTVVLTGLVFTTYGTDELMRRALSFRPEIWAEFVTRTLNNGWITGSGIATATTFVLPELTIQHPHSLFVSTFFYGGLVGSLLFCLVLGQVAYAVRLSETSVEGWLCGMLLSYGVVLAVFDGNHLLTKVDHIWLTIWFPCALAMALMNKKRDINVSRE